MTPIPDIPSNSIDTTRGWITWVNDGFRYFGSWRDFTALDEWISGQTFWATTGGTMIDDATKCPVSTDDGQTWILTLIPDTSLGTLTFPVHDTFWTTRYVRIAL